MDSGFPLNAKPKPCKDRVPLWFFAFVPFKSGEGLLIVTLPLFIVQGVEGTVADVARIHALTALVGVFGFILWGNLSDRLGVRRPFLILGFLGFACFTSLLGWANSLNQVVAYSVLGGFFMSSITPVSSALVLDSFPEQEWSKIFGRFYQISGWSFVVSLVMGFFWLAGVSRQFEGAIALRGMLVFSGIISFLSLLLCAYWVKEPRHPRKHRQFRPQLLGRLTVAVIERRAAFYPSRVLYFVWHPEFFQHAIASIETRLGRYCLCSLLLFVSFNLIFIPLPVFLTDRLQVTNAQLFAIALTKASLETWFYAPIGHRIQKKPSLQLQAQATGVRCLVFGTFALLALTPPHPSNLLIVGLAQILNGMTWAAISVSGTTTVALLAPKDQEGLAIGFYNATIGAGTALGSLGGGYLAATYGYSICFGLGTLLSGLSAIWLWQFQFSPKSG